MNTGWVPRWLNPVSRHSTVSFVTSSHRAVVCWAQSGKITFRYLDIINIAWAGVHLRWSLIAVIMQHQNNKTVN